MRLINGRTPEQWRAFDRWKLIGALVLAALLVILWIAGLGPGRAAACCTVPAADAAPPPVAPPSTPPPTTVPAAETGPPEAAPSPEDGCPETIEAHVEFATNSATLTAAERDLLRTLARCLDEGRFEIAGHADGSGSDAINEPLAEARARAVVEYLVAQGVDASRLSPRGYGSSRPAADDATPEGRARNRRVEIHEGE